MEDLLARMTLDEKIVQITSIGNRKREVLTAAADFVPARARQVFPAGIGQVWRGQAICAARATTS